MQQARCWSHKEDSKMCSLSSWRWQAGSLEASAFGLPGDLGFCPVSSPQQHLLGPACLKSQASSLCSTLFCFMEPVPAWHHTCYLARSLTHSRCSTNTCEQIHSQEWRPIGGDRCQNRQPWWRQEQRSAGEILAFQMAFASKLEGRG